MPVKSKYTVCAKCKVRHSTLVRHRCSKPDKAKPAEKMDPKDAVDLVGGGHGGGEDNDQSQGEGEGQGDGDSQSEDQSQGQGEGAGEGQGDGEGEGEGSGEGEGEGDGEGEGQSDGDGDSDGESDAAADGDGDGESEGPAPQPPEPEAPPVAVVCSVLKFAALTARAAKNGVITVELTEHGLMVYGYCGDVSAHALMGWGEFEARSTTDGQYYVKEVIDGVDDGLDETKLTMLERAKFAAAAHKKRKASKTDEVEEAKAEAKVATLTLPLTKGQAIVLRDGSVVLVDKVMDDVATTKKLDGSNGSSIWATNGSGHMRHKYEYPYDAVADAKLTLPLFVGQKFINKRGDVRTVAHINKREGADVAVDSGGSSIWAATGTTEGGPTGHDFGAGNTLNAVRDA